MILGIVQFHYTDTCIVLGEDRNGLIDSAIKKLGFQSRKEYFQSLPSGLDKHSTYIINCLKDKYIISNNTLTEDSIQFFIKYTASVSYVVDVDGGPLYAGGFNGLCQEDLLVYPTTEELKSWEYFVCPEQACSYPFCVDWGIEYP